MEEPNFGFLVYRKPVQGIERTCEKQRFGNNFDICEQKNGHAISEQRACQLRYASEETDRNNS